MAQEQAAVVVRQTRLIVCFEWEDNWYEDWEKDVFETSLLRRHQYLVMVMPAIELRTYFVIPE